MSVSEIQKRSVKRTRRNARRAALGALPLSLVLHFAALTGWLAYDRGPWAQAPHRLTVPEVALRWSPAPALSVPSVELPRRSQLDPANEVLPDPAPRDQPVLPREPEQPLEAPLPWRAAEFEVTTIVRPREPDVLVATPGAPVAPARDAPVTPTELAPAVAPAQPAAAGVTPPLPRDDNDPPRYPASAQRRGHEGLVLVLVLVGADGAALDVSLAATSGHTSLDKAALAAVKGWRFTPATQNGEPVEQELEVPVRFRLRG